MGPPANSSASATAAIWLGSPRRTSTRSSRPRPSARRGLHHRRRSARCPRGWQFGNSGTRARRALARQLEKGAAGGGGRRQAGYGARPAAGFDDGRGAVSSVPRPGVLGVGAAADVDAAIGPGMQAMPQTRLLSNRALRCCRPACATTSRGGVGPDAGHVATALTVSTAETAGTLCPVPARPLARQ